jgi:hypothetical protein
VQREDRDRIYSKRVRAGKRTYFFDVRTTRSKDYYLTITESRRFQRDGEFVYDKSKMFVYKEDFEKFVDALQGTVDHIKKELIPEFDFSQFTDEHSTETFIEGEPVAKTVIEQKTTTEPVAEVETKTETEITTETVSEPEDAFSTTELKWE